MIITRTPMRIPLGGGGTDLPFFYKKYGGFLVTSAIDKYVYVNINKRFEDEIRVSYSKTEIVDNADKIENDRVKEALKLLKIGKGIEITTVADAPARSGLGSSSSFLVGLLNALHTFKNEFVSRKTLAEQACKIEMDILKKCVGKQDQYISAFGGIIQLNINKKGNVIVSPIDISEETLRELKNNLFLFYTGILRDATDVLKTQKKEVENDEEKMDFMVQIKKIGEEVKKTLERGDTVKFGKLLNIHWQLKRGISNKMSDKRIDKFYDLALKNGALGGKIIGAGGGGFFLFYCKDNQKKFRRNMVETGLRELPFEFDYDGSKVIFNA